MAAQEIAPLLERSMKRSSTSPRTLFSSVMTGVATVFTLMALIPLFAVLIYVFIQGASRLSLDLFTQLPPPPLVKGGGFGSAIVGT
ncbi:MAG TPA: hypothetical protein V6C98_08150, partial [Thermosynechococcaceae cyanobacterium]